MSASSSPRSGGDPVQPSLAISPDSWPCPCHGRSCDPCDSGKTLCPSCDDFFLYPPRLSFYVVADGAAIRRNPAKNVDFASLGGPTNILLSTRNFNYDFAATAHFLIGYTLNDCLQIEGSYIGVTQAENSDLVRDNTTNALGTPGNLFSPFTGFGATPTLGLDYNNFARIRYTSSLQGFELNIRRQLPMPPERMTMSVLFGVRYLGLPEDFEYFSQSNMPLPGGSVNYVHVVTDNQMVGPQIGSLTELYVDNRWWINFEAKAALMDNRSRQSTTYLHVDNNGTLTQFSGSQSEDHTAFAGDLALSCVYRWSPGVTVRAGYQALFLANVALAPNNFNGNLNILTLGPAQLNHGAGTVYHGPYGGVMIGW